jgi:hypothetical protein
MKKSVLFLLIAIISGNPVNGQVGRLLNKVTKSVVGNSDSNTNNAKQEPEPKCACEQSELVLDLGGSLKLMYSEITINTRDDGSILVKDRFKDEFFIVKDGNTTGPIKPGDPRLAGFENIDDSDAPKTENAWANNEYITFSGEKYTIKFGGKSYGPYSQINEFKVTKSKDKFAAVVVENVAITEADGKKMEAALKNAKTDQERMDLSMKYSQMMMQKMQAAGGPEGMQPKMVTNIPNATYDMMKAAGGKLNNSIKFDDIMIHAYDKIIDLQMKTVLTLKNDAIGAKELLVNSSNSKYAFYTYGTLTFSDGTTLSELFNPHLIKVGGQVYLAYMYYSPKRNSIMQCKVPF